MIKSISRKIVEKLIAPICRGKISLTGRNHREKHKSINALVNHHFNHFSEEDNPCRKTMSLALMLLENKAATIIETGSSAWGTNSSLLFDSYVNSFGGQFDTVDIRLQPSINLQRMCSSNTKLHCDDSINFLQKWTLSNSKVDLVYLDSMDVDWENPIPSAIHGLNEYLAIAGRFKKGSLLLVDDTPANVSIMKEVQENHADKYLRFWEEYKFYPGKGAFIKHLLQSSGRGRLIAHDYQLLWKF